MHWRSLLLTHWSEWGQNFSVWRLFSFVPTALQISPCTHPFKDWLMSAQPSLFILTQPFTEGFPMILSTDVFSFGFFLSTTLWIFGGGLVAADLLCSDPSYYNSWTSAIRLTDQIFFFFGYATQGQTLSKQWFCGYTLSMHLPMGRGLFSLWKPLTLREAD